MIMSPQPDKYKRDVRADKEYGPAIPADIEVHNKMAREQSAKHEDGRTSKYARKRMAVSLAPVGKSWTE